MTAKPPAERPAEDASTAGPAAPTPGGLSRRGLFGLAGTGAIAAGAGFAAGHFTAPEGSATATPAAAAPYPFYGTHQAGIVTPAQDRLHFAAFDISSSSRDDLVTLLKTWTDAAARMTQGQPAGEYGPAAGPYDSPPDDTGEAFGLPASGLTITFGFGPSLFADAKGKSRFGLGDRRPAALVELPHFRGDALAPQRSDGDLCVQACADDPQVAVHAIRNLSRIAFGTAPLRWSQLGFGRTSSTSTSQATPRNLFGFKDGTANLKAEQPELVEDFVWVQDSDDPAAAWLHGGSYLVARRINMTIEIWDRQALREQERVIGRTKGDGAPLSGGTEFTEPDFKLMGAADQPLIDVDSHVRIAHRTQNKGIQILRRGYNFADGNDDLGRLDAGLFFISYLRNPVTQYVPLQSRISRLDAMQEYVQHTGSGLFAVPPGAAPGEFVGQRLFD
ncbi:MAG TPA: iron uptake transporter deferrochelatase/peroxidase subunit [Actinopolymorphaceae bacterium]